jgi:hypothetical protein
MKSYSSTLLGDADEQITSKSEIMKNQALAAYQHIEEQGGFFSYYSATTDRITSEATLLNQKRKKLYEDIQDYFMSLHAVQFGISTVDKIQDSLIYRVATDTSAKAINTVLDSAIFKLLTSRLLIRTVTAIAIIATSGPILGILGLSAIALGAAVDTFQLGTTRRLKHEHSKLLQHLNAREKQNFILTRVAPELKNILAGQLLPTHPNTTKDSIKNHEIANVNWSILSSAGSAILKTCRGIINGAVKLMTATNVIHAAALASSFLFFLLEFRQQKSISVFNNQLREAINQQQRNPEAPMYKDRMKLDELTRAQRVQTLALEKTICDLDVMKWMSKLKKPNLIKSQQEIYHTKIQERYRANVEQVETRVKQVRNSRGIIANIRITGENFIKAHDPFSKYNDVSTVEKYLRTPSQLAVISNKLHKAQVTFSEQSIAQRKSRNSNKVQEPFVQKIKYTSDSRSNNR